MQEDPRPLRKSVIHVDNYMWLPLSHVNGRAMRAALAYGDSPSEAKIYSSHVRVPRRFLSPDKVSALGVDVQTDTYEFESNTITSKTTLRDYQEAPLNSMEVNKGGILNLGCGYGKTVVALNYVAKKQTKTAIILGNTSLIDQWKGEIEKHLDVDPSRVGVVRGNKWKWEDKYIVLISLSTLCRRAKDNRIPEGFCKSFGLVIYDECHHLSAPMFSATCPLFYGERHGLTATPNREDGLEMVFINHLGPIHYSKVEQDLIPVCVFIKTSINADQQMSDDLELPKDSRKILDKSGEVNHRKLCAWVGEDLDRNMEIFDAIECALETDRKTLCLTHSVEHARRLYEMLPGSGLATGEVDSSERGQVIRDHMVTFATVDVAAEALDAPELSCLIVMTAFGARVQGNLLKQALGRIQRRHDNKPPPVALFMYDVNIPMLRGLSWQVRKKLYEWEYPIKEIDSGTTREGLHSLFQMLDVPST